MGEDNLKEFHKWKNYETILQNYDLYVYPRISEGKMESRYRRPLQSQRHRAHHHRRRADTEVTAVRRCEAS